MKNKYKMYTYREFTTILKDNNFIKVRQKGDHEIYRDIKGRMIPVTKKINPMVARRMIKEYKLNDYN